MSETGPLAAFVLSRTWPWAVCEILHFVGLTLLLGSVALFDLRVLGLARGGRIADLHRFVPFGVAGLVINALTGIVFFATLPAQYVYNAAFQLKVIALFLAGANLAYFYHREFPRLRTLPPDEPAPLSARVSAAVSLLLLVALVCCGRYVAFYKFVPLFGS